MIAPDNDDGETGSGHCYQRGNLPVIVISPGLDPRLPRVATSAERDDGHGGRARRLRGRGAGNGRGRPGLAVAAGVDRLSLRRRRRPERLLRSPARRGRAARAADPERPGPGLARRRSRCGPARRRRDLAAQATRPAAAIAAAIAALVLLYDAWGKHQAAFGPVNMGLCRGLNLVLGMAAVPATISGHWPLALLSFVYIAAVTAVSRGEVHGGKRGAAGPGSDIVDRRGGRAGGDGGPLGIDRGSRPSC